MESEGATTTRDVGKILAVSGILAQIVMYGIIAIAMYRVYQALKEAGVESPQFDNFEDLARTIGSEPVEFLRNAGFWSRMLQIISWACIGTALFGYQYRAVWCFWAVCFFALLTMVSNVVGMFIGGFILIWTVLHRQDFFGSTDHTLIAKS